MHTRLLFGILICVNVCSAQTNKIPYTWSSQADSITLNKAEKYIKEKDYLMSLATMRLLSEETLAMPGTLFLVGVNQFHLKDYEKCILIMSHIIQKVPENIEPYYFRGMAYEKLKRFNLASDDLILSAKVWPYNASIKEVLMRCLSKDIERKKAIKTFEPAASNDTTAALKAAEYFLFTGMTTKAITILEPILIKFPSFMRGHETISIAYGRKKRYTDAIRSIDQVIAKKPDDGRALFFKACHLEDSGNENAAKPYFTLAVKNGFDWD